MYLDFLLPLVFIAAVLAPLYIAYRQKVKGKKVGAIKKSMIFNLSAFAVICLLAVILPVGGFVSAATTTSAGVSVGAGLGYLGAALATGIGSIGAGIAVGSGSSAAIGAVTEDPKVFGRAILFVGLGEGIAIYGLLISIIIITRI